MQKEKNRKTITYCTYEIILYRENINVMKELIENN